MRELKQVIQDFGIDMETLELMSGPSVVRLHLLTYGSITSTEAIRLYGITRLSSVIYRLRHEKEPPMDIATTLTDGRTRFGQKSTYGIYSIKPEDMIDARIAS